MLSYPAAPSVTIALKRGFTGEASSCSVNRADPLSGGSPPRAGEIGCDPRQRRTDDDGNRSTILPYIRCRKSGLSSEARTAKIKYLAGLTVGMAVPTR